MTFTLQAVNELIKSLESAGELSIREAKVMELARAFKQLAADNVVLKQYALDCVKAVENWNSWADKEDQIHNDMETPTTDRIVAGIKADEAKFIFQSILDNPAVTDLGSLVDWLEQHANDSAAAVRAMREGADK